MPGLNRTGPRGAGPMTGRQQGVCNENNRNIPRPGFRNFGGRFRRGFGRRAGWGGGRGWGYRWGNPATRFPESYAADVSDETALENEVSLLKNQLSLAEKELEQLRKEKNEE
jgi:hypothetical protein